MITKSALFVGIVAALLGCPNDRTQPEHGFARAVESSEGAGAGAHATAPAADEPSANLPSADTAEQGLDQTRAATEGVDQTGATNQNTGAFVQGQRSRAPTRGTSWGFGTRFHSTDSTLNAKR